MRDIVLFVIIAASLPVALVQPYLGVLIYSWISYMNPHRLTYGFMQDFPVAIGVAVATSIGWLLTKDRKSVPMTGTTWLLIIFTLWCSFTTIFALMPDPAQAKWIQFLKIMFMTFLTLSLMRTRERMQLLIWTICVSLGFYSIKSGIFVLLTGGSSTVWGPDKSMIGDNNAFALAILMTIPLMRYLHLTTTHKWLRLGLAGAMGLSVVSVLGSYSRGALLGLMVLAVYFWLKSPRKVAIGIVGAIVLVGAISFMPEKWTDRMNTIETYQTDESAQGRFDAWTYAYKVALMRPITAGGFNAFTDDELFMRMVPTAVKARAAHSIYFEVLGEHGFIGLFMFLAIGFATFRNGQWIRRAVRKRPDLERAKHLGAMVQVSLAAYATSGAFLNMAFFDLFWHLVAIAIINRWLTERELAGEPKTEPVPATASLLPARSRRPEPAYAPVSFLRARGERKAKTLTS